MDTTIYLFRNDLRMLDLDGEEDVPVRELEIRSLLTKSEFLPLFNMPTEKGVHRIILPMFEYDETFQMVVGEEGNEISLDDRMREVIKATRESGFDIYGPEDILRVEQYIHIHVLLAGHKGHIQACVPGWDQTPFQFFVRSNIVEMPNVTPISRHLP